MSRRAKQATLVMFDMFIQKYLLQSRTARSRCRATLKARLTVLSHADPTEPAVNRNRNNRNTQNDAERENVRPVW